MGLAAPHDRTSQGSLLVLNGYRVCTALPSFSGLAQCMRDYGLDVRVHGSSLANMPYV